MKFSTLFPVFIAVLVCQVQADLITVAVNIILTIIRKNLERDEYVGLIPDVKFRFPDAVKDLAAGTLELKDVRLHGFKDAVKTLIATDGSDQKYSIQNVKIYFDVPQVSLEMQYDADLGFVDEIPIYGTGNIRLEISKLLLHLTTEVSISKTEWLKDTTVESLKLDFGFRHSSKSEITNFWRNDTASKFLSTVINILIELFSMWFNYERECINCIASEAIMKIANKILHPDKDIDPKFTCECLKDIFKGKYKLEDTIETLISNYNNNENITDIVTTIRQDVNLRRLYYNGADYILNVLGEKETLKEFGL
ncbi:unnamed protein product [Callosobruchus maculatus]|uniref:Lipid-binding serum glycoprotein N-terminal domain-containing protein n=1 Tax=Callosobruchus maculatus TaxID=64391 RepID=A0A653CXD8_CALMS|nr:unnamed protein product [Callosobruchus maculatus]